ncbi:unnamed protein product, partial [Wuchereria bancrofti]
MAVGESTGNCPDVRYRWKIVLPVNKGFYKIYKAELQKT